MAVIKRVFYVDWIDKTCSLLKNVHISSSLNGYLSVHAFYSSQIKDHFLPPNYQWLFKHPLSVETNVSSLEEIIEYLHKKFSSRSSGMKRDESEVEHYLVSSQIVEGNAVFLRLKEYVVLNGIKIVTEFDGQTLLHFLEHTCKHCKAAFKTKKEKSVHDQKLHSLVCSIVGCERNLEENAFLTETELKTHLSNQLKCPFCISKKFCSLSMKENHMKSSHRKCDCPCGEYFDSRESYLNHFFSFFPLPKSIPIPHDPNRKTKLRRSRFLTDVSRDRSSTQSSDKSRDHSLRSSPTNSHVDLKTNDVELEKAKVVLENGGQLEHETVLSSEECSSEDNDAEHCCKQ